MTRIAIVGAGISGLAAAHAIERQAAAHGLSVETVVLEKEPRIGGKIWSIREDGYLCEWGPNGFLDNKPMTLELCDRLGVAGELLRSDDNARKRFIYTDGALHRLPENGPMFLKSQLLTWPGKLRIAREIFVPPKRDDVDETLAAFARRRLGQEALDKLIGPMVSGIFAGDPETMSVASCFPRIVQLEQEYGGLIRAMVKLARQKRAERKAGKAVASAAGPGGTLTSFRGGIQELTDATARNLRGAVRSGAGVSEIRAAHGGFVLHLENGSTVEADLVVSAAPAYAAAGMVKGLDADLAAQLSEIRYAPMNVVCFGYAREKIARSLDGFGYLVTRQSQKHILGTLWDSSIFANRAPQGSVLLRSMMGGATNTAAIDLAESEVVARVRTDLRSIMGIEAEPDFIRVFRHERAIPQYTVGHGKRVLALGQQLEKHPGLFMTGNAYFGVGLNDCVHAANQVAERAVGLLRKRAGG